MEDTTEKQNTKKERNIMSTGALLGSLGTILVSVLAIVNYLSYEQIVFATKDLETRSRKIVYPNKQFVTNETYIISKNEKAYAILKEVADPPQFETLAKEPYIEYTVIEKDAITIHERQDLKKQALVISEEQANTIKQRLKDIRIKPTTYYEAFEKENSQNILKGWVIKHTAIGGYSGNIDMLIGFDDKSTITGYLMVKHNETPGLGVKANYKDFIKYFIGKTAKDMPSKKKNFKSKLGVNSISGATITSVAVTNGIKSAYKLLNVNQNAKKPFLTKKADNKSKDKEDKTIDAKKTESKLTAIKEKDKTKKTGTKTETKKQTKRKTPNKANGFLKKIEKAEGNKTN